jgi:hypothetical protein
VVKAQERARIMPKLHQASPVAWGLLRWGKASATVWVHWCSALALYNVRWRDRAVLPWGQLIGLSCLYREGLSRQLLSDLTLMARKQTKTYS